MRHSQCVIVVIFPRKHSMTLKLDWEVPYVSNSSMLGTINITTARKERDQRVKKDYHSLGKMCWPASVP